MTEIEIFLQGEGVSGIALVRVQPNGTVQEVLEAAKALGAPADGPGGPLLVLLEDTEEVLASEVPLERAGIGHRSRVHVHRCRQIEVTVNFNHLHKAKAFPPSATIEAVKRWAVGKEGFGLGEVDAAEHVLQLCNTTIRPDEDIHIGSLVQFPSCTLCFDLVPKQRVEG